MTSSLQRTPLTHSPNAIEGPDEQIRLGNVDNTGDTVASPNYGSRVEGHVVNLGDGGINIATTNNHNYSLEAGAVLNVHPEQKDERNKIATWLAELSSLDFVPAHRRNLAQRCNGVGTWVFQHERFQEWYYGTCRTLWIYGVLGCGKTILASNIIEHLETQKDGSACLFIFFDYLQKAVQTPYNITVDLLRQLVQQHANLSEPVRRLYKDFEHLKTPPSSYELINLINLEIRRFGKVRLIVDGLDECPAHASNNARAAFFHIIRNLAIGSSIMFTSRGREYEKCIPGKIIELEYAPTPRDLDCYLRAQIQMHCTYNEHLEGTDHEELVEKIASQASGMLLLARLHVNDVAAQHTLADLQAALKNLPANIKHTYEKAMRRIPAEDRPFAERVLMWLTFAVRPLTMKELRSALAANENITSIQAAEKYMHSERRIIAVCEGLVVLDHQVEPNIVRLIHPTARAHFEAYFDNDQAHKSLAIACLRYLQFEDFKIEMHERENILTRPEGSSFVRYAAKNWGHHTRQTQDTQLNDMSVAFLERKLNLVFTAQAMDPSDYDPVSGLYIAAYFGLVEVVDKLLLQNSKAIKDSMYGETPMHTASREGHVAIVKILLSHKPNPDQISEGGRTPVSLAAENGHLAIVRLLISSYGVNPNSKSTTPFHKGRTSLSWASGNGHHAIVEYLLAQDETQVDTSISTGPFLGRTALMLAARNGHQEVVRSILEKGQAAAGIVDGEGMSALALAAQQGYPSIVKLLLPSNAAAAKRKDDIYHRRPVDWALHNSHEEVVKLLLTYPSLDFKDYEKRTTLSYEAQYGHHAFVQRLLDLGADPNSRDEEDWTPLSYAAESGHTGVIKLLLQGGADANSQSTDRRSPLSFASQNGHSETVNLLLISGAKADEIDRFGRTPLSYACGSGRIEVTDILLNYDVDVNLKTGITSWTTQPPIMWAAANGHEAIVKKLLQTRKIVLTPYDKLFQEPAIDWAKAHGFAAQTPYS